MLSGWIRDQVKKHSFIEDTAFKNGTFYMYYTNKEGKKTFAKLPYRATRDQLQAKIARIKEDVDFATIKKERDKKIRESIRYNNVVITHV